MGRHQYVPRLQHRPTKGDPVTAYTSPHNLPIPERSDLIGLEGSDVTEDTIRTDLRDLAVATNRELSKVAGDTAAVASEVELKANLSDSRMWQRVQAEKYSHVLADAAGRVGLGIMQDGAKVAAPGGVLTPRAGVKVDDGGKYGYAIADAAGRVSEIAIGNDGRFPARTLAAWAERMGWASGGGIDPSATKLVGVALTLPDTTTPTASMNNTSARLPVRLGANVAEWRIHIRNSNDKSGTTYPGALNFAGIFFGEHERAGDGTLSGAFTTTPTQVAAPFSTASTGEEWVSDWVTTLPLTAGTDYLLSYGYSSAPQNNYLAAAGGWTSNSAGDAGSVSPTLTAVKSVPLDVWIEARVAASTPAIMYLGDSLALGIQATLPVYDSWAAKHAIANGAIHSVYAIGGSQATDWTDMGARRLNKWQDMSRPNAAITALGNNDIYSFGVSLATMKSRTVSVLATIRANFTDRVYLATILPRIGASQPAKDVWSAFNEWLVQLPAGAVETFDFAERIATPTGDADPRWSSTPENFHLSTAGYARCATTITHRLA